MSAVALRTKNEHRVDGIDANQGREEALAGLVAVAIVAASITLCRRITRVPSGLVTSTTGLLTGEEIRRGDTRGEESSLEGEEELPP